MFAINYMVAQIIDGNLSRIDKADEVGLDRR